MGFAFAQPILPGSKRQAVATSVSHGGRKPDNIVVIGASLMRVAMEVGYGGYI